MSAPRAPRGSNALAQVTYEVLVLQGGKWTIESRYSNAEREEAISDAKSMHENPHVVAVKVIKETHDPDTGSSYESTVFSTEAAKMAIGATKNFADMEVNVGGGPDYADMDLGAGGFTDFDEPAKPAKPEKKKRALGKNPIAMIFMKILFITTLSLLFAFLATYIYSGGLFS